MIRTQIYLPKDLYNTYRQRAKRMGTPAAQQIREALERDLKHVAQTDQKRTDWAEVAKRLNITGGPKDLSRRIDDYLYGDADD